MVAGRPFLGRVPPDAGVPEDSFDTETPDAGAPGVSCDTERAKGAYLCRVPARTLGQDVLAQLSKMGGVLTVAQLAVYLDYGHWHLIPGLEQRGAQTFGLLLYLLVAAWMRWTVRCLESAFAGQTLRPTLMESGPFRHVRHPLYAGAMVEKIAIALVFASAVGWMLAVLWWLLLLRQVRLEEVHLRKLFGSAYEAYALHTARLIPGVY